MPIEADDLGAQAAFVLEDGDRFHKIITSGDIRFPNYPGNTAVITFFIIRRALGTLAVGCAAVPILCGLTLNREQHGCPKLRATGVDLHLG